MSEVCNSDQKVQKYLFFEYFMTVRKFTNIYTVPLNIFALLLILMVGSRIHYSLFASYAMCHYYINKSYGPTERGIGT